MYRIKYKIYGRRAYSIAEIIVAMALIVMLSVLGFMSCYTALAIQRRSEKYLAVWSGVDSVQSAFEDSVAEYSAFSDAEQRAALLLDFHKRLSFAVNAWVLNVNGFTGEYAITSSSAWSTQVVMESEIKWSAVYDEVSGTIVEQQISVPKRGLALEFKGADRQVYAFEYRYYTPTETLVAYVAFSPLGCSCRTSGYDSEWSEEKNGFVPIGKPIYTSEREYQ